MLVAKSRLNQFYSAKNSFMKPLKPIVILFLSVLFANTASTQVGVGHWREHLPYQSVISVAEVGQNIYAATPFSIMYYNTQDASISRLSKVNGLSETGIKVIVASPDQSTLIIAYTNTNIDLVQHGRIINISDIERKPMPGNKTINNIIFINNYAYLACGFGIVVLDINRHEIVDTYLIGPDGSHVNVLDIAFNPNDSHIYAATAQGIYKADINSPNLAHFVYWNHDYTISKPNDTYNHIVFFQNQMIVNRPGTTSNSDSLFLNNGETWNYFLGSRNQRIKKIRAMDDELMVAHYNRIHFYDAGLNETMRLTDYQPGSLNISDAIISKDGTLYTGDLNIALMKQVSEDFHFTSIGRSGPTTTDVFAMEPAGSNVWFVAGARNSAWNNTWKNGLLYGLVNNNWVSYNRWNTTGMENMLDIISLAVDPNNKNRLFAGSWGRGLIEMVDGTVVEIYNETNSSLQEHTLRPGWVGVGGIAFDDNGNTWFTNNNAPELLSVRKHDGSWRSFNLSPVASAVEIDKLVIDHSGQKWILERYHGLYVFNDNGTIDNPADDQVKRLTGATGNGNLPGATIHSLAVDQNGEIWIGTNEGVAVIRNPENVFNGGNYDAYLPIIDQDGYGAYLLESETVTAIVIDGANRKWFGTDRAGAFLMSADGLQEIHHFNTENSPMLSNSITAMTINDEGEVFFGTTSGIVSFRTEATPAKPVLSDVIVFPNPVRPEYDGVIAVKGLVKDADIKITDIAGNLIFKTRAFGGQAVWNGRNFDGRRAQSGVYLVFVSNNDGSETLATKILFLH